MEHPHATSSRLTRWAAPTWDEAAAGVVDHRGEVFGYRNLFVADGAIVPEALGLNPSKTIAALAERIAELIVRDGR
jgi:choline dehydrogenase-like flavoprotein